MNMTTSPAIFFRFTLSVLVLLLSTVVGRHDANAEEIVLDSILASIDGEPVTLTDLRRHVSSQMYAASRNLPDPKDLSLHSPELRQLLQDLVLSRLLDKEADAVGISVSNEEIDAYIAEIRRQNNVDEEGFRQILQQQGLTWKEYEQQIRNDILKNRVVSARVRSKITVVDGDVKRYLAERPDLAPELGSIRLQQIRIPTGSAEQLAAAKKQLASIAAQCSAVEGLERRRVFARAGGPAFRDLGHVRADELRSEISTAVAELAAGELSEPISFENAAYLFLLAGIVTEETPFDEALRDEIRDEIFQVKFQEELKSFLDVDLPKRYHVEFKL